MTLVTFAAVSLTSFGLAFALFILTIANDPVRIIVLMLSAFFWLLSLFVSSLCWSLISLVSSSLWVGLALSIVLQETFRLAIYFVFNKADGVLKKLTENENTVIFEDKRVLYYVVGLGFALMSGAFSMANLLADCAGPGSLGFRDESVHFFMFSAVTCSLFIICNTCWGIIAFAGIDNKSYGYILFVWTSHLFLSFLTLFNEQGLYTLSIVPLIVLTAISMLLAFLAAGGNHRGLKLAIDQTLKRTSNETNNAVRVDL